MKAQALDLGTGFSIEIRMPTKNVYEISGTGFSMEIRMPTKNIWISDNGIGHLIQYGDNNAHQEWGLYTHSHVSMEDVNAKHR